MEKNRYRRTDKQLFVSFLAVCICLCFSKCTVSRSVSPVWAGWARHPPPFIRPEPIIMTSPQGSIHFNYHPLSNVCVRKPGKHFCMLGKVTDCSRDLFGNGDILCDSLWKVGHIFISERFGGTGCSGQTASFGTTSAQPAVRWLFVIGCVFGGGGVGVRTLCYYILIKISAARSTKGL